MQFSYTINNNTIHIPNHPDFDAEHIIECGQVFRYEKHDFGYVVYSLHHKAVVYCQKDATNIVCDDVNYFVKYFDLDVNYGKIKVQLNKDAHLNNAIKYGHGIRILRQDLLEVVIGFIISANNNIARIRQIMDKIARGYGKNMGDYYAFPTLEKLSTIPLSFFEEIKSGYRANYLKQVIAQIANGFDLSLVHAMTSKQAISYLTQLSGVGPKVADCILLYGYHRTDSFPIDTWMKKVFYDYHPQLQTQVVSADAMRNFFITKFGDLSGYAQQYLFYNKRKSKN